MGNFFIGYGLMAIAVAITLHIFPNHVEKRADAEAVLAAVVFWPIIPYAIWTGVGDKAPLP